MPTRSQSLSDMVYNSVATAFKGQTGYRVVRNKVLNFEANENGLVNIIDHTGSPEKGVTTLGILSYEFTIRPQIVVVSAGANKETKKENAVRIVFDAVSRSMDLRNASDFVEVEAPEIAHDPSANSAVLSALIPIRITYQTPNSIG